MLMINVNRVGQLYLKTEERCHGGAVIGQENAVIGQNRFRPRLL
jgi:hypothetical protein